MFSIETRLIITEDLEAEEKIDGKITHTPASFLMCLMISFLTFIHNIEYFQAFIILSVLNIRIIMNFFVSNTRLETANID